MIFQQILRYFEQFSEYFHVFNFFCTPALILTISVIFWVVFYDFCDILIGAKIISGTFYAISNEVCDIFNHFLVIFQHLEVPNLSHTTLPISIRCFCLNAPTLVYISIWLVSVSNACVVILDYTFFFEEVTIK